MALVPPIMIQIFNNQDVCSKYDLSTVRFVFTGAAPLGSETMEDLLKVFPKWRICQGYGTNSLSMC